MSKNLCEFFGRKLLTMSHNPAFLGGHWSNTSRHIRYLMRHVTPQNHVIERPSNFMRGSSSCYVTTLPSLVAIGIAMRLFNVSNLFRLVTPPWFVSRGNFWTCDILEPQKMIYLDIWIYEFTFSVLLTRMIWAKTNKLVITFFGRLFWAPKPATGLWFLLDLVMVWA